jgi:hypothetical protein
VISKIHASCTVGNYEFTKNMNELNIFFLGDGMKQDVHTFVVECDVLNEIREKLSNLRAHSNCFRFHQIFGGTFLCISLWDYLNLEISHSSWW